MWGYGEILWPHSEPHNATLAQWDQCEFHAISCEIQCLLGMFRYRIWVTHNRQAYIQHQTITLCEVTYTFEAWTCDSSCRVCYCLIAKFCLYMHICKSQNLNNRNPFLYRRHTRKSLFANEKDVSDSSTNGPFRLLIRLLIMPLIYFSNNSVRT